MLFAQCVAACQQQEWEPDKCVYIYNMYVYIGCPHMEWEPLIRIVGIAYIWGNACSICVS